MSARPWSKIVPCRVIDQGDLIAGSNQSYIATLVERHTRYVMLVKVANRQTQTVIPALIKQSKKLTDRAVQIADLGSRQGTGPSSTV